MPFDALLYTVAETGGTGNLIVQGSTTPAIISGQTVSFDGGTTFVPYTYLGQGNYRGTSETADFIQVGEQIYAFNSVDPTGSLSTGNWEITVSDLDPVNPPCFVAGTLIDTERGPRPVDSLMAGDRVCVEGGQTLPIIWIGKRTLSANALRKNPKFRPVRIQRGALGDGLPNQDLFVSPQHRIVLEGWRAELLFGEPRVFCAAIHLVDDGLIRQMPPVAPVTYFHIACSRHVVLSSHGLQSESLFLGDLALKSFQREDVEELRALFPELRNPASVQRQRTYLRCLKRPEAEVFRDLLPG